MLRCLGVTCACPSLLDADVGRQVSNPFVAALWLSSTARANTLSTMIRRFKRANIGS